MARNYEPVQSQAQNRATGVASGQSLTEQQVTALFDRLISQKFPTLTRDAESLQLLLGERPGNKAAGAIRRQEMLLDIKTIPEASAAPTVDEHNRLVRAFNALAVKLADIARKQ